MTAKQIWKQITPHKKVTLRQVQNYIRESGIKHQGIRQRPQQYPDDSAEIILRRLGYSLNGNRKAA